MKKRTVLIVIILLNLFVLSAVAQENEEKKGPTKAAPEKKQVEKPTPDIADGRYGSFDGLALMAINYRLLYATHFPDNYLDCARAIQFARYNAKDWNIDKQHIAASGSSAGGITSLWIGFHDDLADPKNADRFFASLHD